MAGKPITPARRRVMLAVLALAVGSGTSSLSMRAIAREVDIKAASIYSLFPGGKDEMLEDTLRWNYVEFLESVFQAVGDDTTDMDPVDELRRVITGQVTFQLDSPWENLFEALLAADRAGRFLTESAQSTVASLRGAYIDYMESMLHELGCRENVRARSRAIINFLNYSVEFAGSMPQGASRADFIDEAFHCCVRIAGVPTPTR